MDNQESLKIYYPSGANATVRGKLILNGPIGADAYGVAIELTAPSSVGNRAMSAGEVLMVDPRCVIVDCERGIVIFSGRDHYAHLPKAFQEYLDQHPEWPRVLELPDAH